jgi:uncharacterized membrane protein HdeD (DUF308 family)
MVALIVGIIVLIFGIIAILPMGLNWWHDVLLFLRGCVPVIAILIGLLAIVIGIADIKDQIEAKKEEQEQEKQGKSES